MLLDRGGGELSTDMSPAVAGGGGEARTGRLKAAIDGDDRSRRGNEMASDMRQISRRTGRKGGGE